MFKITLSNPKGINKQAAWDANFQAALTALQSFNATTVDAALDKSLSEWEKGSAGLAADPAYQAVERYCIRQSYLWKIYAPIEAKGLGKEADRKVYNRAKDVLAETPKAAQPADVRFAEGDDLIKNTLDHLREVDIFYQQATSPAVALESFRTDPSLPDLPPSDADFLCTVKLPIGMPLNKARHFWQQFMADNSLVRLVALGGDDSMQDIVTNIADPTFFDPGGNLNPGRCLWVEIQDIQKEVRQWLQQQGAGQADQVRCVFIKASGKLSSVLKTTDTIDETAIIDEFLKAATT